MPARNRPVYLRAASLEAKLNRPINRRPLAPWPITVCGHATAAPLSTPRNSRRLMSHSKHWDRVNSGLNDSTHAVAVVRVLRGIAERSCCGRVRIGSIASILTCPRYVRLAGNSGNVDWLLNGSTLGVIHVVYAPTSIRIRHPSCSPTVARRPADRERSPTAGFPPLA